ncbi:hypothetical protein AHMF7605_00235 [Adhaeribacter arboris]|uniref:Glycosyl transferase n=1 Tax=Adhaeribacter arboris TaxID=2072846 RepID=A0A2T2Y965_9BACT|nr:hypothetical protein [Adhaeribacter arboris]PSR52055.1 hypothetical protein AHMF7605_00235 [Adhaeribacter arboris]
MQNFFEWFAENKEHYHKPWLILGKGPSYAYINQYNLKDFFTVSLNHVIKKIKVTVAHAIDFDVVESCAQEIDANAQYLVLPWHPHFAHRPTDKCLVDIVKENEFVRKLDKEGRLLWYYKSTRSIEVNDVPYSPKPNFKNYPEVPVLYFSAEAVVNLLGLAGAKKIRSLGVDGGTSYSKDFKDLAEKTLLANGQSSFDLQFKSISKTIMKLDIDYAPLNIESPIRIFVGSAEPQLIPVKVLEYSIRKHTTMSVEVFPLYQANIPIPLPKDPKNKPRTPFSFQRFLIPTLKGFKGRAIYLDSDMQVFSNIVDLWSKPFEGGDVLSAYDISGSTRKPQFAVMLMNCEKLNWNIQSIIAKLDSGELNYEQLMYEFKIAKNIKPVIEGEWNSLEHYEEGKTHLLHYTDMTRQPWITKTNPLGHLWVKELVESIDNKFISLDEVKDHIKKGYLRPSLLYQISSRKYDVTKLPPKARALDKFFTPPHELTQSTSRNKIFLNNIVSKFVTSYIKG